MNWFARFWKPKVKFQTLFLPFKEQQKLLKEKRECFFLFLSRELADVKAEILHQFSTKQSLLINVSEAYGFFHFLIQHKHEIAKTQVRLRVSDSLKEAHQIALIFLRELGYKQTTDPIEQLKALNLDKKHLFIIEDVGFISQATLKVVLNLAPNAKFIFINYSNTQKNNLESGVDFVINIPPLTTEKAAELTMALLNFRSDLILTSADRRELVALINISSRLPELIFMALATPQQKVNLTIEKYVKSISSLELASERNKFDKLLQFCIQSLPEEAIGLLQIAANFPVNGFTSNDLYLLCKSFVSSKEEVEHLLEYLSYVLCFRIQNTGFYELTGYLRIFLQDNFAANSKTDFVNEVLIQRLESNLLWQQQRLWVSQLEQTLTSLNWVSQNASYGKHRYFLLFIQSILTELCLWRDLEGLLVPLCNQAVSHSENNEERGFWYSLLGLLHRGLSKFKEPKKELDLSLNSFQKSLKFYDPQKQQKRYSFVYQNMGLIYDDLYLLDKSSNCLKQAIKSYYKALGDDRTRDDNASLHLKRLLAKTYVELGQLEKGFENFQKAFGLYKQILLFLQANKSENDSRLKLLYIDLEKLLKIVNGGDLNQLDFKKQIEDLLKDKPAELNR